MKTAQEYDKSIRNLMRLFLQSIQDYEHENGDKICHDDRPAQEFVDIFLDSTDAFNYKNLLDFTSEQSKEIENLKLQLSGKTNFDVVAELEGKVKRQSALLKEAREALERAYSEISFRSANAMILPDLDKTLSKLREQ